MAIFLDTETTGLSPRAGDAIVEVAIIGDDGRPLIDTLVNPRRPIPYGASRVHGISDSMVRGMPTLVDLLPDIKRIVTGEQLVIYNATFDAPFFPGGLGEAGRIDCAMRRYSEALGLGRWQKLDAAAEKVGHVWTGAAHRAKADALACRSVWKWLEQKFGRKEVLRAAPPPVSAIVQARPSPAVVQPSAISNAPHVSRASASQSSDRSDAYCPNCIQRHRVPKGHVLEIRCIGCGVVFRAKG